MDPVVVPPCSPNSWSKLVLCLLPDMNLNASGFSLHVGTPSTRLANTYGPDAALKSKEIRSLINGKKSLYLFLRGQKVRNGGRHLSVDPRSSVFACR